MTTDEIDALVHDFIISNRAYPSPLHYKNFPKSICTSVNNVICHGKHYKKVYPTLAVIK